MGFDRWEISSGFREGGVNGVLEVVVVRRRFHIGMDGDQGIVYSRSYSTSRFRDHNGRGLGSRNAHRSFAVSSSAAEDDFATN